VAQSRHKPDAASRVPLHKHPALPPLLILLGCLALMGTAVGGVFKVKTVQVDGKGLPVGKIVAAADLSGRNIFRVRSDAVVAHLQAAVREIAVTEVDTEFPDRVVIHARMRQRFAAWQRGNRLFIVDPQGQIVDEVRSTKLPMIVGPAAGSPLTPGVVQAVGYARSTLPAVPAGRIARFEFGPRHGLTIVGQTGWRALIGRGSPQLLDTRIASLAALLKKHPSLLFVDLRLKAPYARFGTLP
jgi:hypothetical protein